MCSYFTHFADTPAEEAAQRARQIRYYKECVIPAFPGDPKTAPPSYRYFVEIVERLHKVQAGGPHRELGAARHAGAHHRDAQEGRGRRLRRGHSLFQRRPQAAPAGEGRRWTVSCARSRRRLPGSTRRRRRKTILRHPCMGARAAGLQSFEARAHEGCAERLRMTPSRTARNSPPASASGRGRRRARPSAARTCCQAACRRTRSPPRSSPRRRTWRSCRTG